jgi:hypothetical protein
MKPKTKQIKKTDSKSKKLMMQVKKLLMNFAYKKAKFAMIWN